MPSECLTFTLAAIYATARAIDVWEGWVMLVLVVPVLTVKWLRYRNGRRALRHGKLSTGAWRAPDPIRNREAPGCGQA